MNIKKTKDKNKTYVNEIIKVKNNRVGCDGGIDFGHPLVYLSLDKKGEIMCPYCSKKYILGKS